MTRKHSIPKLSPHTPKASDFKVPWWSRLLGDFRAYNRARLARKEMKAKKHYVCTVTVWAHNKFSDGTKSSLSEPSYYHLSEGKSRRYAEFHAGRITLGSQKDSIYHRFIYPWLHGKLTNEEICNVAKHTEMMPK